MSGWEPDRAWLDARFDRAVRSTLFARREPEVHPVAVLLGGQPGAGKSRAAQFARELHDQVLVVINGDDFRALHPDFKRLQRDDPEQMPRVTQAVSAPLVERSIRLLGRVVYRLPQQARTGHRSRPHHRSDARLPRPRMQPGDRPVPPSRGLPIREPRGDTGWISTGGLSGAPEDNAAAAVSDAPVGFRAGHVGWRLPRHRNGGRGGREPVGSAGA